MNDSFDIFGGLASALRTPEFLASVLFALIAIVVYHWGIVRPRFGAVRRRTDPGATAVQPDLTELRSRLAMLESQAGRALQNVGFVRFNAFPDVGSELSYALAVVDERGNGFIVSSIYSREEVRTYAKAVRNFTADKEVSTEERDALAQAQDLVASRKRA
ncbi:MAG TPA: DUF4446 family protein [Candidatus Eremiobacteraceae bacterium]|jgi:hypothetical protein